MVVKLQPEHPKAIQVYGEVAYPKECCGLMLGRLVKGEKHIVELLPADNAREEDQQHNRFLISPQTMFQAEKCARGKGMDVLGFYHSHPNAEACPSQFDLDHAWPFYSYIIISVLQGQAGSMTCWKLSHDRASFSLEDIQSS